MRRALDRVENWCGAAEEEDPERVRSGQELSSQYITSLFLFTAAADENQRQQALLDAIAEYCAQATAQLRSGSTFSADEPCIYWTAIAGKLGGLQGQIVQHK